MKFFSVFIGQPFLRPIAGKLLLLGAMLSLIATTATAQTNTKEAAPSASSAKTPKPMPQLVTDRAQERTGFQESAPYSPAYDLRTDLVLAYGIDASMPEKLKRWAEAGYVLHLMTGIAWGEYQDYLDGDFDGRKHWDEGQVDAGGKPINHGVRVPYISPTVSFSRYMESKIQRIIDACPVAAIHLEEPEFWARAGFSEAFKREWQLYYNEPWQRPDSSCEAQYRASKLKYYLYGRTLDRVCSAMKEYALEKHGKPLRFYVPTHSLINYSQWSIVSPESSLVDMPGVDGFIAQVWTGTSRTPNIYQGRLAERTFETAYLEYGVMQELVRGSDRRMWFLHDPIEDNPRHTWDDYRENYICTLVASLLHPGVCHYEVSPWPNRIMKGRFPAGDPKAKHIGADYATVLSVVFNQLRDMDQSEISYEGGTDGVGVLLADSAMFQRADPAFSTGCAKEPNDPGRATSEEIRHFTGFYGMAIPLVKHGIPARPVQLDNVIRSPGYLDDYKVLLLSYEFMKPSQPAIHQALAEWVRKGGTLIYFGADTDPFNTVREWWNKSPKPYAAPSEHLMECLELGRTPKEGEYRYGKGMVLVERKHPAYFSRSAESGEKLLQLVRRGMEATGGKLEERNWLRLRRGPYIIAAVMDESLGKEPMHLQGRFVNLLDAGLPVLDKFEVSLGKRAWLLDLDRVTAQAPAALAAAGRIESWTPQENGVKYSISSIQGVKVVSRILLPAPPKSISIDGKPSQDFEWHEASKTVLVRQEGSTQSVEVTITW